MKIEDLVLSVEQMRHLKELGLEVNDTALAWVGKLKYEFSVNPHTVFSVEVNKGKQWQYNGIVTEHIPTLTLQEILEMLPEYITHNSVRYGLTINHEPEDGYEISYYAWGTPVLELFIEDSLFEAAYNMLCWVAQNGFLNKE